MKTRLILCSLFCAAGAHATVCPAGYTKDHVVTINSGQVSNGPLSNYVARIVNVSADFAVTGSGGYVTSNSGYDIIAANSAGSPMTFDMYRYDSTTGNFEMNVLIPSANTGSTVTLCFGNGAIVSYQGSNTVWDANYVAVSNFGSSVNLNVNDISPAGNNGTNTSGAAAAGLVTGDGAVNFTGNGQHVTYPTGINLAGNHTIELWVNYTTKAGPWFSKAWSSEVPPYTTFDLDMDGSSHGTYSVAASSSNTCAVVGTTALSTSTWVYIVGILDNTNSVIKYFYNGAQEGGNIACPFLPATNSNSPYLNQYQYETTQTNIAKYAELRVSNVVRSADTILTTYRNISAPGTFYAVGGLETPSSPSASAVASPTGLPVSQSNQVVVSIIGTGTAFTSSTRWTVAAVAGVSCAASPCVPTHTDGTHQTITLTTIGANTGTLTITESVTGSTVATLTMGIGGGVVGSVGVGQ